MNRVDFWTVVIGLGIGTLSIRASFLFLYRHLKLPASVKKAFAYIPVAVLPALVIPSVFYHHGQVEWLLGYERFFALIIATIVSYKANSVILTIVSGLATLYLFNMAL